MQFKKYKIIYFLVLAAYLFFALLCPVLHNHDFDGHDHDDCQACNWVAVAQVQGANIILVEFLLFILFVLFHPETAFKPLNLISISSRAPPVVLI